MYVHTYRLLHTKTILTRVNSNFQTLAALIQRLTKDGHRPTRPRPHTPITPNFLQISLYTELTSVNKTTKITVYHLLCQKYQKGEWARVIKWGGGVTYERVTNKVITNKRCFNNVSICNLYYYY